jgi:hypothetical protein
MADADLLATISQLAAEEHELERTTGGLSPDQQARLEEIGVGLDQCWDLLRQRRARRSAGLNPDEAEVRDPSVVERYRQ